MSKLEEACGCDVPDVLKATVISVIEDHCNSCLSPIAIDLISLGDLPEDFKLLFSELMKHVYSMKSNSRALVVKVLKVFAEYENPCDPQNGTPVPPSSAEHDNGFHEPTVAEVVLYASCSLFFFINIFLIFLPFIFSI